MAYAGELMTTLDLVNDWPVTRVAAGTCTRHGARQTAGQIDSPFPLASVTKPLFAYAVLVAIEEGTLHLDQEAGPPGATVRHLLAHASGLADDPVVRASAVARRRIYSNAGFELLGQLLEQESGIDAATYLAEAVTQPLGMNATRLLGSPAHGAESTVNDLLNFVAELLHPTLISAQTLTQAATPQFPDLDGVLPGYGRQSPNYWGLGFEIRGHKSPHWTGLLNAPTTFGHFGRSGTFLWVDPHHGVGCVALTDRTFGSWAVPLWPGLSDQVIQDNRIH